MTIYDQTQYETTLILDHIRPQCDISPTKVETGKNYIVDGRTSQSIQAIIYTKSPFITVLLFKICYALQTCISFCSFICCIYFALHNIVDNISLSIYIELQHSTIFLHCSRSFALLLSPCICCLFVACLHRSK